jgi:cytochrome b pre-mRNA-processing protein 3
MDDTHPPPYRSPAVSTWALLIVLALAAVAFFVTRYLGERRLLEDMPPTQRAALLRSELETFRLRCAPEVAHRSELDCRARAREVLRFPECDAACRAAVEPYAPAASR